MLFTGQAEAVRVLRTGFERVRTADALSESTDPPGHLWRDKWTALSGPLSERRKQAESPFLKESEPGQKREAATSQLTYRYRQDLPAIFKKALQTLMQ